MGTLINTDYCDIINQGMNKLELSIYLTEHIKHNWEFIINNLKTKPIVFSYEMTHVLTIPHDSPIYESSIPKPKYWTFCFIRVKQYPNSIFMLFSDHDDKVHCRLTKNNKYLISCNSPCIIGTNEIPNDTTIACIIDDKDKINYITVEWKTGMIYKR